MDEQARQRELTRINERIAVIANWLIQGRCGDDPECIAARMLEMEQLTQERAQLEDQAPA